jgi:hypothetical protein
VTPRNFWADGSPKSGVAPTRFSLFFSVTFHSWCRSFLSFSDSYLVQGVKKKEKRKVQRALFTLFTDSDRILVAHRGTTRLLLLPAAICWARGDGRGFRGNEVRSLPRISVRNGFTRPTGDINVNSPYILRSPPERRTSREIFEICQFSFGDPPTPRRPPAIPWVRPSYEPFTFPHCRQRSRLFEIIEPHTY